MKAKDDFRHVVWVELSTEKALELVLERHCYLSRAEQPTIRNLSDFDFIYVTNCM